MDTPLALTRLNSTNLVVVQGDLTRQPVAALVNAANESLQHGGGVAQAIVRTGGRVIQEESDAWVREHGPVGRGRAAVTTGGMLIASHVIHVVGPRYREGQDNSGMLADATTAALAAAVEHDLHSIAFPAISAGIFGYPPADATAVMVGAIRDWLAANADSGIVEVRLVGFSDEIAGLFAAALSGDAAATS